MDFDEIVRGQESVLEEMTLIQQQEGLQLDFKTLAEDSDAPLAKDGKLNREGRKVLSRLLSAFSNSAGGVIVFGVDCRSVEGLDCASELRPFRHWRKLQSYIGSQVGDLLQPKNDRIRVEGFSSSSDPNLGYVIVDVPRSERRPHMCVPSSRYFKRSGSDTYTMEHYDVEDAFRRAASAEIELDRQLVSQGSGGIANSHSRQHWLLVSIVAENVGAGTAKHICVKARSTVRINFGYRSRETANKTNCLDGVHYSYLSSDDVIHPGEKRTVETFPITAIVGSDGRVQFSNNENQSEIQLSVEVLAENAKPARREMIITASDVVSAIR